ncbi:hypothetical protein [Pleurocapsa sp. PCC 7319]|uniref:hypothetical protein n=1 Tax=Pleurocapsa sp. PCC 7319 TaxID=118161 RepID=UPI00034B39B0|nr:hypothetical protein [Pleurocapsa sp. PCC 7319]
MSTSFISCDDFQTKTTCELYHAVNPSEFRLSIQSSLYYYLHHVWVGRTKLLKQKKVDYQLKLEIKEKLKGSARNLRNSANIFFDDYQLKYRLRNYDQCDVIFNHFISSPHGLGIQKLLAKQCQMQGLRTGIVGFSNNLLAMELPEFNEVLPLRQCDRVSEFNLSSKTCQEIIEQCSYIYSFFEKFHSFKVAPKVFVHLTELAIQIEQNSCLLKHLLEMTNPKLVILSHGKYLADTAMQIACQNTDIPSMLIPHGFPQRSLSPLSASFVMSYCPHHDNYLRKISLASTEIINLGWLEPKVRLPKDFDISSDRVTQERGKFNILFLSSLSGWDRHRCESLLERVPEILKALNKMPEVETINVRLRSDEYDDLVIKTLLTACAGSKLRISGMNSPITDDVKACDIAISFNSTGVLYAPYLSKKAIEIRDQKINSVWGGTVLPSEQVYQIEDVFDAEDFSQFVLESPILNGKNVFYNWGNELEAFSESLSKIVS